MPVILPSAVSAVYKILVEHNFPTYLVGGSVRNILLGKPVKDWDMTTKATPEEILKLFPDAFYDNMFGTVGVPVELAQNEGVAGEEGIPPGRTEQSEGALAGGKRLTGPQDAGQASMTNEKTVVEVTTFRTEESYSDTRHPDAVAWGKTVEEDLERRDFTMNAIAMQVPLNALNKDLITHAELIDPSNGQEDLKNHIIRAVGDPTKRFKEDALRLMRAIRFASQLSFTIEDKTWQSIQEDAVLLGKISGERIRDELLKILASDFPYEGVMLLKNAELLEHILPELLEGIGISQERPGRHHIYDVFEHNLFSLKYCPSKDPLVRFATLIHDIGKPRVEGKDENGLVIFYNHEVKGAKIAYEICNRLHFSKKEREKVIKLIRWHMFSVDEHITDAAVRRFIRRIGVENVKDLLDVRVGDRLGSGIPEERAESWRLRKFRERIEEQLKPAPFSINDLAIDGNDIMQELGMKPGPQIGKLLQQLFEEVDENLDLNTRDYLLKRVHELSGQRATNHPLDTTQIILESERLRLVPLSEKYAKEIFRELTEEITTYMFPRSPKKIDETLEYIHAIQPKMKNGEEFAVTILDKNSGEFLGGGGIHKINTSTPELGIWIKKSAHGNKYGREAVTRLKKWVDENIDYTYITYPVAKKNIPSRKIAESLGGIVEKEMQTTNMSGNILDEVEYRIYKK